MIKLDITPDALTQLSGLVGLFLPLLVAYIVNAEMSKRAKQFVAIILSVAGAIAISVAREGISYDTIESFVSSVFVIVGVAQTFYLVLWSTILKGITERLENAKSPVPILGKTL